MPYSVRNSPLFTSHVGSVSMREINATCRRSLSSTPARPSIARTHLKVCCHAKRSTAAQSLRMSTSPACTAAAISLVRLSCVSSGFACISAPPVVKSELTNQIHHKSRSPRLGRAFFIIENDGSLPAQTCLDHQQAKAELHGAASRHAAGNAHVSGVPVWLPLRCWLRF